MRVLIVDDSEDMRTLHTAFVSKHFPTADIETAENGLEAYQLYEERRHDLVLSDMQMPAWSGYDLACAIRSIDRDAVIVLISGVVPNAREQDLFNLIFKKGGPLTEEHAENIAEMLTNE